MRKKISKKEILDILFLVSDYMSEYITKENLKWYQDLKASGCKRNYDLELQDIRDNLLVRIAILSIMDEVDKICK